METLGNNLGTNISQKEEPEYFCELCDFKYNKKYNWERHIATSKHKMNVLGNQLGQKEAKCNPKILCEKCKKTFQNRSGLWKHKKKCFENLTDTNIHENQKIYTEVLEILMKQNKDMQNNMIDELRNIVKNVVEETIAKHNGVIQ